MDNITEYSARLNVDYPEKLNRLTTLLRFIWAIPIAVILFLITPNTLIVHEGGEVVRRAGIGFTVATGLMIIFRQRYPRWWFDFQRELTRFGARVLAYIVLVTDLYPSTVEEQSVHLDIDYPDVNRDLNRWLPLVKWLLAIPHYIILIILFLLAAIATIASWFFILFTGQYPRGLFDFVVGVGRWTLRVGAYAFLLVTDQYPPFSLR